MLHEFRSRGRGRRSHVALLATVALLAAASGTARRQLEELRVKAYLPVGGQWAAGLVAADIDGDGDADFAMSTHGYVGSDRQRRRSRASCT